MSLLLHRRIGGTRALSTLRTIIHPPTPKTLFSSSPPPHPFPTSHLLSSFYQRIHSKSSTKTPLPLYASDKPSYCYPCRCQFPNTYRLLDHNADKHRYLTSVCPRCGSTFFRVNDLIKHFESFQCVLDWPILPPPERTRVLAKELDWKIAQRSYKVSLLSHVYYSTTHVGKNYLLFHTIQKSQKEQGQRVVIMVSLPSRAINLNEMLRRCDFLSVCAHYEMDIYDRSKVLDLVKDQEHLVLVLTHLPETVDVGKIGVLVDFDEPGNLYLVHDGLIIRADVPVVEQFLPGSVSVIHHYTIDHHHYTIDIPSHLGEFI